MPNDQPLVSVLIPTFNSRRTVARAIESAQNQTYSNLEIVVQDNASTDGTYDTVQRHAALDSRLLVERNSSNSGPLRNWQLALNRCRGDYVKVIWSDDWIEPDCIDESVRAFDTARDVGVVFTAVVLHSARFDEPLYRFPSKTVFRRDDYLRISLSSELLPVSPGCAMIRRRDATFASIDRASAFFRDAADNLGAGPDLLFLLRAVLLHENVVHIPKFLSHFEASSTNISSAHPTSVCRAYAEARKLVVKQIIAPRWPKLAIEIRMRTQLQRLRVLATRATSRL